MVEVGRRGMAASPFHQMEFARSMPLRNPVFVELVGIGKCEIVRADKYYDEIFRVRIFAEQVLETIVNSTRKVSELRSNAVI